jgi:hypothetical protein
MNRLRKGARGRVNRTAAALAGCLALIAASGPQAFGQGCALCYQSAAATGSRSIVALQHGILILLIPSVGLFVGIFGLIYRRRNVSR